MLSLFTLFHFAIIFISTGPLNPVSLQFKNFTDNYKTPLLYQSWNLFAPDPVSHTDGIAIKVKNKNGEESDWFDIGKPLLERNQENSFSPFNRAARVPTGLIQNLYEQDEILNKYNQKVKESDTNNTSKVNSDEIDETLNEKQMEVLYRFSFSMAQLIEQPDHIDQVKVRLINNPPVPFSKRNDNTFKPNDLYVEYDWRDYETVTSIKK